MPQPFFTLRMTNIRDAAGVFRSMADKGAVEHARNLARGVGKVMVEELKKEAPVGKHYQLTFSRGSKPSAQEVSPAERLKDSFFYRTYVKGKGVELGVYVKPRQRKKAGWVIRGTSPFKRGRRRIYPKTKKALAFYWARKKQVMVLPYVDHPGSLPNPFHERALRKGRRKIEKMEKQAARLIAEGMFMRWPKGMVEII